MRGFVLEPRNRIRERVEGAREQRCVFILPVTAPGKVDLASQVARRSHLPHGRGDRSQRPCHGACHAIAETDRKNHGQERRTTQSGKELVEHPQTLGPGTEDDGCGNMRARRDHPRRWAHADLQCCWQQRRHHPPTACSSGCTSALYSSPFKPDLGDTFRPQQGSQRGMVCARHRRGTDFATDGKRHFAVGQALELCGQLIVHQEAHAQRPEHLRRSQTDRNGHRHDLQHAARRRPEAVELLS